MGSVYVLAAPKAQFITVFLVLDLYDITWRTEGAANEKKVVLKEEEQGEA